MVGMRRVAFALHAVSALLVAGAAGCGGSDGPPDLTAYFQTRPYADQSCNTTDQALAGQREMRLFVHGATNLVPITQGLASYYSRHSLSFFTAAQPQTTTMAYAVDTKSIALTAALTQAFPGVDLNDEQALMADPVLWNQILTFVANFMFKPIVDFAHEHGGAGPGVTNLVLLSNLERPGGEPLLDPGASLAGLAISPALLAEFAATMAEESAIWQGVQFPADFTPMMVLGNNVLQTVNNVAPVLKDLVTSHEFGHTAALVHTTVLRNLMYPNVAVGRDDCHDSLDDTQLARMRATLGVGAAAASGALLSARAAPTPPAAPTTRTRPLFTPARLRALLAGDRREMRSLIERLLGHP
jgi:hypothetical protein